MAKWQWIPFLCLVFVIVPCDTGVVIPDLGILVESFNRLTAPPNKWVHVPLYFEMIASVVIIRR